MAFGFPTLIAAQQAVVIRGQGDIGLEERAVPVPGPGEALVAVRTVGICGSDLAYLNGTAKYPIKQAFVLGHEAAGEVIAVGPSTDGSRRNVEAGMRVALVPGKSCGSCASCRAGFDNVCADVQYLGSAATNPPVDGALQQFVCAPIEQLQPVPDEVSYATAALLEPLAVAEHAVRRADVTGRSVLVMGGGTIGQLAAIAAHATGAATVTVCEVQSRRRNLAVAHQADNALSPEELEEAIAKGQSFDAVIDATGSAEASRASIRAATPGSGRVVIVGNLPPGTGPGADLMARNEIWVTATFRFPGGLQSALALVTSHGVDIDWLVELTAGFDSLRDALSAANAQDPPLKVQIAPGQSRTLPARPRDTHLFEEGNGTR